ncbi:pupal cuticle protein G1A-like [Thrips palmi]|uniref:Pupal cuticle protein G1A-like n=1 Tax=Thrips palmi TaxID=161013 RepID=A0A6P8YSQ6_THRPL|nr:pupal cuticle protein G1A-like [Thrips palmi]
MKVALFVLAVVASASAGLIPATTLLRAPQHDSAVIQSERLGGNFAYSSVEGHAYQAVSPVVQHVQTPVAVSYHATPVQVPVVQQQQVAYKAAPVVHTYAAAAPVVASTYAATPVVSSYAAPLVAGHYGYGAYAAGSPVLVARK